MDFHMKIHIVVLIVIITVLSTLCVPILSKAETVASTNHCITLSANLAVGNQDNNDLGPVTILQNFLLEKGYFSVKPTGYFGSITKAAVAKFQEESNMPPSGFVGPITRSAIEKITCANQSAVPVTSSKDVNHFSPTPVSDNAITLVCPVGYTCTKNIPQPTTYSCPPDYTCVKGIQPPISTVVNQSIYNNTTHNTYIDDRIQTVVVIPTTPRIIPTPVSPAPVVTPPKPAPDPVPATPPPDTSCPQSVTIDGIKYSLSPCSITMSMIDGEGDKNFSTTIMASGGYGFSVYGYGNGFPVYSILGVSSGGASGNTALDLHFNDSVLSSDGDKPKVYSGYLPINVYQGSATGWNQHYMYLNLNLTVYPAGTQLQTASTTATTTASH